MWFFKKKSEADFHVIRDSVCVRMEAIGGQGAHSTGRIIAKTAALSCEYTANHYSSFGSEKRGTPVRSFVRISTKNKAIRSASYIDKPNVMIVFHESLIKTHPQILDGSFDETDLIVNSPLKPQELELPNNVKFRFIATLDATKYARQSECNINAVMLGAFSEFCPEIPSEKLRQSLASFYTKASDQVKANNLAGYDLGKKHIRDKSFSEKQAYIESAQSYLPTFGWENAPIGGVIVNPGSSILKDNSASRKGIVPKFLREVCFDCGYCDAVCPDYCFVWDLSSPQPSLKGIDYQYCKACEKCVQACPASALTLVPEAEITEAEKLHKFETTKVK